jgi:histidine triad (HIT) family protein
MTDCIFCKIVAGGIPANKVFENDEFLAFLDIHPINLGHTLIVPKEHHENLFDLPENLLEKIMSLVQKVAQAVEKATEADGINIGMNNKRAAGQLVDHAHIHIIPRFENDGLVHWPGKKVSSDDLMNIGEKIKNSL